MEIQQKCKEEKVNLGEQIPTNRNLRNKQTKRTTEERN